MTTITYDTYHMVNILKEKGFSREQASGVIEVLEEIDFQNVASKEHVTSASAQLEAKLYRALAVQTIVTIGAVATIVQIAL